MTAVERRLTEISSQYIVANNNLVIKEKFTTESLLQNMKQHQKIKTVAISLQKKI